MILFDHPIWPHVRPYAHLSDPRGNLDFLQLPDQLRALALGSTYANCVSCQRVIKPLRARAKSARSRVAGTELEHRLFYAPTCLTEENPGCSRTTAAQQHKEAVRKVLNGAQPNGLHGWTEVILPGAVATYDALCLKEPWLELILLGIKTLETRTKCMRRSAGPVVLASSLSVDDQAWDDPRVGGRLDATAKERALAGRGQLAGLVLCGGFRPGVPGVDDEAACIAIALPDGATRFVSPMLDPKRLERVPTTRVRPDGTLAAGASQGFFKVPASMVKFRAEAA